MQKPWKWPALRRPGAHARARARLHQVDRRQAAEIVALAVAREVALVRAPAQLGRLRALADEAVHRPGVDELARLLGLVGDLRVALGDVDDLDAELARERRPSRRARSACRRPRRCPSAMFSSACLTKCETRPGFAPCVSTAVGRTLVAGAQRERLLAQRIVGALAGRHGRVGVAAGPRLDAGVEVHRALLPAQLDQRDARDVDRHIEQEVAAPDAAG